MIRNAFIVLMLLFATFSLKAQAPDNSEYGREFIYGINKSSNSGLIGGFVFRYSSAITNKMFHSFAVEIVNIKHPKEQRYITPAGGFFIPNKQNYLIANRLMYGRDFILFKKAPQQGVQINGVLMAGPNIGLIAPYFIEILGGGNNRLFVPYDPAKHSASDVQASGGIFMGIPKSEATLGLSMKAGLSFEFSPYKSNLVGFETGFALDAYTKEIIIQPGFENRALYPSVYLNLFWGSRR